jgi:hypothetical protein
LQIRVDRFDSGTRLQISSIKISILADTHWRNLPLHTSYTLCGACSRRYTVLNTATGKGAQTQ